MIKFFFNFFFFVFFVEAYYSPARSHKDSAAEFGRSLSRDFGADPSFWSDKIWYFLTMFLLSSSYMLYIIYISVLQFEHLGSHRSCLIFNGLLLLIELMHCLSWSSTLYSIVFALNDLFWYVAYSILCWSHSDLFTSCHFCDAHFEF